MRTRTHLSVFLRSFLVQAAWNYRTMLGTGVAFALLPALRELRDTGRDVEAGDSADSPLERHAAHFNAHPYLATAALGALARLESDAMPGRAVTHFRDALRGPLGALGDRLVWAGWLPLCALLALAGWWAGASPAVAAFAFLGVYNVGHLALRIWGYRTGWRVGTGLGGRLREARVPELARRVQRLLVVATGLAIGTVLGGGSGREPFVVAAGVVGVAIGIGFGERAWKPAAVVVVAGVAAGILFGWVR